MATEKWALAIDGPDVGRGSVAARITLHASEEAAKEALWQYVLRQCNDEAREALEANEDVDRDEVISEVMEDERETWMIGEVWE